MTLLNQAEIEALLTATPPLIDRFDPAMLKSPLTPARGASLDLTVGRIFAPGAQSTTSGEIESVKELALEQGHTALLETAEAINIPPNIGAIAFPPSSVSMKGLLTTNPGHIDPGYHGPLHLTVINMGAEVFALRRSDRILRLLLMRLSSAPTLQVGAPNRSPIDAELLRRLSLDFMDVERRAAKAAEDAIKTAQIAIQEKQRTTTRNTALIAAGIGVIPIALGTFITWAASDRNADIQKELANLKVAIGKIESRFENSALQPPLLEIKARLDRLELDFKQTQQGAPSQPAAPSPQRVIPGAPTRPSGRSN